MADGQASSSGSGAADNPKEYIVRAPKNVNRKFSLMKFNPSNKVDFTKYDQAKIERENNFKEYKLSYDIDAQPKFGAGSEFGREQKDEARRRKYGIQRRKYNVNDQPWLLNLQEGKEKKRLKGIRSGGLENTSYYVFTQCADGAFEAFPVDEIYNFTNVAKYKHLNAEEAEEHFERRDKTLNYFTIMVKKRLNKEEEGDGDGEEEGKKGKKKGKKSKNSSLMLTEMEDWMDDSDISSDDDAEDGEKKDKPKAKKGGAKKKSKLKLGKSNSDDEAVEESDDEDEGREVDYITSSDSDDADMYDEKGKEELDKYKQKGMDEMEEEEEEEEVEDEELKKKLENGEKEGEEKKDDSNSESSDSGSDSDPEKDGNFTSALFMQKKDKKKGSKKKGSSSESTPNNSRSATPTNQDDKQKAKKRKPDGTIDLSAVKKPKIETVKSSPSDAVEEAVRRYLSRKPMTIKDLLYKLHKATGTDKKKLAESITDILKKINPDKFKSQDNKLFLHIKKTE